MALRGIGVALVLSLLLPAELSAETRLTFLGVVPRDSPQYGEADRKLIEYLSNRLNDRRTPVSVDYKPFNEYTQQISETLGKERKQYLARMTPYAFVMAEMLGARLDVLATYESGSTGTNTYHAYFVVNKADFGGLPQNLIGMRQYLADFHGRRNTRPKFVFHDKLSTSSYFLPALWLRENRIFEMPASNSALTAIETMFRKNSSSTESVVAVATGGADFAAVWDATRNKFTGPQADPTLQRHGEAVLFIGLPQAAPNDMLVASIGLDKEVRAAVLDAIKTIPEKTTFSKEFRSWTTMQDAEEPRRALAALRQSASAPPAPVVVRVHSESDELREALEKALRLSKPRMVKYDSDFHKAWDVEWTLEPIHDEAVLLTVTIRNSDFKEQFPISYLRAGEDLTTRIMALIHSRMARICYVWPYWEESPTILGDIDFTARPGDRIEIQEISWNDPRHNSFGYGAKTVATIDDVDSYQFKLRWQSVGTEFNNPLSNLAYRAVVVRPSYRSAVSELGMGMLVLLLLGGAGAAAADLRRRTRGPGPSIRPSLADACRAMADKAHDPWRTRRVTDADLVWCARPQIEATIEELKTRNLVPMSIGGRMRTAHQWGVNLKVPFLNGALGSVGLDRTGELVAEPSKVGDAARLSALLELLVSRRLLSSFVGRPTEWEALESLVVDSVLPTPPGAPAARTNVVKPDEPRVLAVVSRHFNEVLADGRENLCLYDATWTVVRIDTRFAVSATYGLPGTLQIGQEAERVTAIEVEFDLPASTGIAEGLAECWVLGKIGRANFHDVDGHPTLRLSFLPMAVLADFEAGSGTPTREKGSGR